jgi:tight adherence protein B
VVIAIACFLCVLGFFIGAYWFFVLRLEGEAEQRIARRLQPTIKALVATRVSLLKQIAPLSSVPAVEKVLAQSASIVRPLEQLLERSGLSVTVGQVVLACALMAALGSFLALRLSGMWQVSLLAAAAAGCQPVLAVRWMAKRRINKFEEQFPEAIDLIARALRAGHALTTALGMVADEAPEPVRSEFRLLYDRQNFGMPLPDALKSFADRLTLLDARFFATSVLTQRESGGNLGEVLDNLSALIRERFRLKRHVRAVSAHGRMTGWVLGILPTALAGIIGVVSPGYMTPLFHDPIGKIVIVIALFMQAVGVLIMRRIIDVEI